MKMTVEEYLARIGKKGRKKRATPVPMVQLMSHVNRATGFQQLVAPILTESLLNVRYDKFRMHKTKKRQEGDLRILLQSQLDVELARVSLPLSVTLWRIAPRRLDQGNLQASHKATQDAVARWIGVDDGDVVAYDWWYEQRSEGSAYGIEVVIRPTHEAHAEHDRARWDRQIEASKRPKAPRSCGRLRA